MAMKQCTIRYIHLQEHAQHQQNFSQMHSKPKRNRKLDKARSSSSSLGLTGHCLGHLNLELGPNALRDYLTMEHYAWSIKSAILFNQEVGFKN